MHRHADTYRGSEIDTHTQILNVIDVHVAPEPLVHVPLVRASLTKHVATNAYRSTQTSVHVSPEMPKWTHQIWKHG